MPLAFIVDNVYRDLLASGLNEQRKTGLFCDVHLKVWGQTLPTHSCVLSACSPYFRRLIVTDQHDDTSCSPREIELPQLEPMEVVTDLIDYIYTGRIELKEGSVQAVVKMAEVLALEGLASLIRGYVNESTKIKNPAPGDSTENANIELEADRVPQVPSHRKRPRKLDTFKFRVDAIHLDGSTTRTGDPSDCPTEVALEPKPIRDDPDARVLRARKRIEPVVHDASDEAETYFASGVERTSDGGTIADNLPLPVKTKPMVKRKWFRMCRLNGSALFKCKQCEFESTEPQEIRNHKLLHPGNSYVCVSCGYVSRFADKLLLHLREAEASGHAETTTCSLCGSEMPDRDAFLQHLTRHDDPKPFFCEHCGLRFASRWCLKTHSRKHATLRPHVCQVCGRGFKVKGALQAHAKTHGPPGAVKGFLCGHCGFRTAYKHNLLMHERIHNGDMVSCPVSGCNHRSNSEYSIQAHLLVHSKQRPYQCEVCGANFSHPSNLRQHAKLHNLDANTIRCRHCEFTTLRIDKLRSHARKVHGDSVLVE